MIEKIKDILEKNGFVMYEDYSMYGKDRVDMLATNDRFSFDIVLNNSDFTTIIINEHKKDRNGTLKSYWGRFNLEDLNNLLFRYGVVKNHDNFDNEYNYFVISLLKQMQCVMVMCDNSPLPEIKNDYIKPN